MESQFGQKTKKPSNTLQSGFGGYIGKAKTGTKKTKTKSPKIKPTKVIANTEEKKSRKPLDRMDRVPQKDHINEQKQWDNTIPTWVRESSEKKPNRKEGTESKLQWRKETKKSQRSFSKNKERDYAASKPRYETDDTISRKPFGNTFEKKQPIEGTERKSSWDKNSVKPGTGFEKSKTGYKWVGSAWDKSTVPRVITRKWDTDAEKIAKTKSEWKAWGYTWKNPSWEKDANPKTPTRDFDTKNAKTFPKPSYEKNTAPTQKSLDKKPKYTPPKPTWEKEYEVIDKKKLIDPTK